VVAAYFMLPFLQLVHPVQFFVGFLWDTALFLEKDAFPGWSLFFRIHPMGGNPIFCLIMHFLSPDLNFDYSAIRSEDGGVEGLVSIRLREGNIILDASDHRTVFAMNDPQCFVTVGYFRNDDPDRNQIIDARDVHVMAFQFEKQAIEMLGPSAD